MERLEVVPEHRVISKAGARLSRPASSRSQAQF